MDNGEALGRWVFLGLCVSTLIYLLAAAVGASPPVEPCHSDSCLPMANLAAQQSIAVATWWMTGIGVLSTIVALVTLYAVVGSLEEARKVTREAARSAGAAEQALVDAHKSTKMQTRAYVAVTGVKVKLGTEFDTMVDVFFVNAGQSPARHVETTVIIAGLTNRGREEMVDGRFEYDRPWEPVFGDWSVTATAADLPPNQQRQQQLQVLHEFNEEHAARMSDFATYRLTLVGRIGYFDVFGDQHVEAFDYVLDLIAEADFPWDSEREMERAPGVPRHL